MNEDDAIRAVMGVSKEEYEKARIMMDNYFQPIRDVIVKQANLIKKEEHSQVFRQRIACLAIIAVLIEFCDSITGVVKTLELIMPMMIGGMEKMDEFMRMQNDK